MGRIIAPLLVGLIGAAILVSLGVWQVQRMTWKAGVLADMDARISGTASPLPAQPDSDAHRFLPVEVTGRISDDELHVLTTADGGPAFRIISVFMTEDGRRLLLDRGIVRDTDKDDMRQAVDATVAGNLHWPDEVDSFTPEPDRVRNIWYARDVGPMAARLSTEPVLIVARETSETDIVVTPRPVDTDGIPNDHLQYAITWFSLAIVWIGMTAYWIRRIRRGAEGNG